MSKTDLNPKVVEIKNLYKSLKNSRTVLNWDEFANKIKYDRVYISRVMNGHEPLTEDLEKAIQNTFGNTTSFVPHENTYRTADHQALDEIFLVGPIKVTAQEYVDALKKDKEELQEIIKVNLTALTQMLSALARHDQAYHETILRSLARIEKLGQTDSLVLEAGTLEAERFLQEHGKHTP